MALLITLAVATVVLSALQTKLAIRYI